MTNSRPSKPMMIGLTTTVQLALGSYCYALDFKDVIQEAVTSHPSVQSKRFDSNAAQDRVTASVWQLGPNASLQSGKNAYGQTSTTTRIQQPIFNGGKLWSGVKEARARRDLADNDVQVAQQTLLNKLVDAYFEVDKSRSKIIAAQKNLKEHQRLLELIRRRAQAGLSANNDVITAEMRLQQAASELQTYQSQEIIANSNLEELISRPLSKTEPLIHPNPINIPFSWEEAKSLTINNSANLKSQQYQLEATQERTKIERAGLLPQVYLRYEKYSGNAIGMLGDQTYIAIEYQFGNGVSTAYNWSASLSQEQSARSSISNSEKDVLTNFSKDWNQWQLGKAQLPVVEKQFNASTEVMASFLRQYNIGKKSWLDVLNAQREMNQTIVALIDTKNILISSNLKVAIATGLLNATNTESLTNVRISSNK